MTDCIYPGDMYTCTTLETTQVKRVNRLKRATGNKMKNLKSSQNFVLLTAIKPYSL